MASAVDPDESNGSALTIAASTLLALTYVSVGLRTYVRGHLTKSFLADDWLMLVAQTNFTISCVFIIVGVSTGLGRHNRALPQRVEIEALKWQALATASYVLNMLFIKLSIAVFLLRLSTKKKYTYVIWASCFVMLVFTVVMFFWNIFQCSPVQAQWDYTIPGLKCVSSEEIVSAAYAISVITILTDWLYALMPIPMIWKVKMSTQAKATVIVILGLGVFASVATLIRVVYLADLNDTSDILFAGTNAMVWTLVEPGVAIIASSLVTIRPLLRKVRLPGFLSTAKAGSASGPTYRRVKPGQSRSRNNNSSSAVSNGMTPGLGPADVVMVDLEAGQDNSDAATADSKNHTIKVTTVTNITREAANLATAFPESSARLSGSDGHDGHATTTHGAAGSSVGGSASTRMIFADGAAALNKALPPTPKPTGAGFPPIPGDRGGDRRLSTSSEIYVIEGKLADEAPTPATHTHTHDRTASSTGSALHKPTSRFAIRPPIVAPAPPLSPSSVHSEDHEVLETHSQHDGGVGLAIRSE